MSHRPEKAGCVYSCFPALLNSNFNTHHAMDSFLKQPRTEEREEAAEKPAKAGKEVAA